MSAFCGCCGKSGCVYAQADVDEAMRLTSERDKAIADNDRLRTALRAIPDFAHGDECEGWDDGKECDCGADESNAIVKDALLPDVPPGRFELVSVAGQALYELLYGIKFDGWIVKSAQAVRDGMAAWRKASGFDRPEPCEACGAYPPCQCDPQEGGAA